MVDREDFQHLKQFFFLLIFYFLGLQDSLNLTAGTTPGFSPLLPPQNKSWVNNHTSVLSDFDGDNRSDLAIGESEGDIYKVEIQLSTLQKRASLSFGSSQAGIRLVACDVDRDNDQDLILVSPFSLYPLAIWLNDGKGHFEEGDRWLWLNLITSDSPLGVDLWNFPGELAFITPDNRLPFDNAAAGFQAQILEPQGLSFRESHLVLSSTFPLHLKTRSPPS
ncbi:MAG: hypothetical protein DMG06_29435 [Acidobacteria bacterium]|nr:MAG: hypothetical protein DMG06_29435 [Acidobacteriota bacterium]